VVPARLHHSDAGIGEEGQAAPEQIVAGDEIGIEDQEVLARSGAEALLQRAGLESVPRPRLKCAMAKPRPSRSAVRCASSLVSSVESSRSDLESPSVVHRRDGLDRR
jgi:hypothetical protein